MPDIADIIREWKVLFKKTHQGEWRFHDGLIWFLNAKGDQEYHESGKNDPAHNDNGAFCAWSHNNFPALIAHIERVEGERDAAVRDIKKYARTAHTCIKGKNCQCVMYDHLSCEKCNQWQWRGLRGGSERTEDKQ